ncbi:MAG: TraR/DksA C4-type zinc finger protein [Gemmataceae bacterium]|nr:TraR/DksA C4-type zinc finger protein [Gemmataceae bacterium]MDW8265379.1 TraR/DksA C4-type zinc finger protein [Gemmataceae bacterium]
MARRDALLRLHKSLMNRRTELRRRLGMELQDLRKHNGTDTGDTADAAFDTGSDEIASQLAQLEARELAQIERALTRMKQGTYGICEGCQCRIPVARLNALPYTTTCVRCQREMEMHGNWSEQDTDEDWGKISDAEFSLDDQRDIDLSDLEMDLSK